VGGGQVLLGEQTGFDERREPPGVEVLAEGI
jgi:hypothetical protein